MPGTNTLAYLAHLQVTAVKYFTTLDHGACTIKHYGLELGFFIKLACLSKLVKVTDNNKKHLNSMKTVHFQTLRIRMFYDTGTWVLYHKTFFGRN